MVEGGARVAQRGADGRHLVSEAWVLSALLDQRPIPGANLLEERASRGISQADPPCEGPIRSQPMAIVARGAAERIIRSRCFAEKPSIQLIHSAIPAGVERGHHRGGDKIAGLTIKLAAW